MIVLDRSKSRMNVGCGRTESPPPPISLVESKKFYDALVNATIGNDTPKQFNCPTATIEEWRTECIKIGLLDKDKPKSASALFSKHKRELIVANKVACNETMAWTCVSS
jgi:hypothetical protein